MKNGILFLLLAVTVTEAAINTESTSISTTSRTFYMKDFYTVNELTQSLMEEDTDFYRIEKNSRRTKNDTAWHYIRGASTFSSTANAPLTNFLGNFGFEHSTNAYSFNGYTPFTSALFNVKYMIDDELLDDNTLARLYSMQDGTYIYKNNYTLPLGFMINSNMATWNSASHGNPLKVQNSFAKSATGKGDLFYNLNLKSDGNSITIKSSKKQRIYVWISSSSVKKVTVEYGNGSFKNFENLNHKYIIDLGMCGENENIKISSQDVSTLSLSAYGFNEENFVNTFEVLNEQPFIIDSFNDTGIIGNIDVNEEGLMLTSIPYDNGWKIWVDYAQVEPIAFNDAVIALNLSEGKHIIKFSYEPEGLRLGTAISLSSIALFLLIIAANKYTKYFKAKHNLK